GFDDDSNGVTDDISEAGWPGSDDFLPTAQTLVSVRTIQTKNYIRAPDPFDPVKVHAGSAPPGPATLFGTNYTPGYNLHPLIVSAGPDKKFDIVFDQKDAALNINGQP